MGEVILRIVEQHIAEPAADDDAEGAIDQEIVDTLGARALVSAPISVVGDDPANERPTEDEAGDIGERVPADGERTPLHDDGIDRWKGQNKCWHRPHADALGRGVASSRRAQSGPRAERSPDADNDVGNAGIGEILLPVEAAGARSGMIRLLL